MGDGFPNNTDILVITEGYWDTAKRIRHKMPMQWARAGARVLWIEQSPFPDARMLKEGVVKRSLLGEIREVMPSLFVGAMPPALPRMYKSGFRGETMKALQRPFYVRRLRRYLTQLDFTPEVVVLFQQAARRDIFALFEDAIKIYYHHDVYGYGYATPAQQRALEECCKAADLVWCVAKEHCDELVRYNPRTHFLPHAVDGEWYASLRQTAPPAYSKIPEPRMVYTGVFQEKMDLPLLIDIAEKRPKWHQVFVGPVEPKNLDRSQIERLKALPNVHFIGEVDVDEIPGFLEGATALILPYLPTPNMASAGLSLKFYEYLISGKPIVVAPYTKMQVNDALYYLADGADEWTARLDRLSMGDTEEKRDLRIAAAMENSYKARLDTQSKLLAPFFYDKNR